MLSLSATQSDYDRLSYAVMQSNNAVLAGDRTHGVQPAVSQFYWSITTANQKEICVSQLYGITTLKT